MFGVSFVISFVVREELLRALERGASVWNSAVPRVSGGTDSDRKDLAQLRVQLRKSETEAKELKRRLEISERRAASLYISISSDRNK